MSREMCHANKINNVGNIQVWTVDTVQYMKTAGGGGGGCM